MRPGRISIEARACSRPASLLSASAATTGRGDDSQPPPRPAAGSPGSSGSARARPTPPAGPASNHDAETAPANAPAVDLPDAPLAARRPPRRRRSPPTAPPPRITAQPRVSRPRDRGRPDRDADRHRQVGQRRPVRHVPPGLRRRHRDRRRGRPPPRPPTDEAARGGPPPGRPLPPQGPLRQPLDRLHPPDPRRRLRAVARQAPRDVVLLLRQPARLRPLGPQAPRRTRGDPAQTEPLDARREHPVARSPRAGARRRPPGARPSSTSRRRIRTSGSAMRTIFCTRLSTEDGPHGGLLRADHPRNEHRVVVRLLRPEQGRAVGRRRR